jgi:hypothetical protein
MAFAPAPIGGNQCKSVRNILKLSLPVPPRLGDLVLWEEIHIGIVEDVRGIDILVRWSVPIEGLPGCSHCTESWLTRGSVYVLARAKGEREKYAKKKEN